MNIIVKQDGKTIIDYESVIKVSIEEASFLEISTYGRDGDWDKTSFDMLDLNREIDITIKRP